MEGPRTPPRETGWPSGPLADTASSGAVYRAAFQQHPSPCILTTFEGLVADLNPGAFELFGGRLRTGRRLDRADLVGGEAARFIRARLRELGMANPVPPAVVDVMPPAGPAVALRVEASVLRPGVALDRRVLWTFEAPERASVAREGKSSPPAGGKDEAPAAEARAVETARQARFLLRTVLDLHELPDVEAVANRAVEIATGTLAEAVCLQLLGDDGRFRPVSGASGWGGAEPDAFRPDHPLVREVVESGSTGLEIRPEELEGLPALEGASGRAVMAAVPCEGRTRGIFVFAGPGPERDILRESHQLLRQAFVGAVGRALARARQIEGSEAVVHDLRAPLNAILGYADLLLEGIPEKLPPGAYEQVRGLRSSAAHLEDLLQALYRPDTPRRPGHPTDLPTLLAQVRAVIGPAARRKDLELHVSAPAGSELRCDPVELRQILVNLLENAVRYTREGEVALEAEVTEDGGAVFRVRDTGRGMASEEVAEMFRPRWRGPGADAEAPGGSGLGLATVRQAVEDLGGRIDIASRPGRGTLVTVELPGGVGEVRSGGTEPGGQGAGERPPRRGERR